MPQAAERLKGDKALLMQRIDRLIVDLEQILVDRAMQELLDLLVVVKLSLFLRSFWMTSVPPRRAARDSRYSA